MKIFCLLLFILLGQNAISQVIPAARRTDWSLAGYRDTVPKYNHILDITSFGGVGDGITINDTAIEHAIVSLAGTSGTIYFPVGNFLFTRTITLFDSIVLKGNSSDSTVLTFNLHGSGNLITMHGGIAQALAFLTADAGKDSSFIMVDNASPFIPGDYLQLIQNDSALIFSSWALNSVGQIAEIKSVSGHRINLGSPLRKDFKMSDNSRIIHLMPCHNIGIECLKINRTDSTAGQTSNIDIDYAAKCWIKGVESNKCNFAHVAISHSSHIEITGCFIHDAFAYGDNGQGYGIVVQYTSGECLVENNVFDHLRHAMLLQAGANGNVFGYNSSTNPFWVSGALPANSAGDMLLHGNYHFLNLFEGNLGQNIVVDNSHGINGPYNTYFRNRADLYGIFMNSNPASDNQNFVGNEVTNTNFPLGLYIISGTGNLEYGNNIHGSITPAHTDSLTDTTYYKKRKPGFFEGNIKWPGIGPPNAISSGTIPARERALSGHNITDCRTAYLADTTGQDTTGTGIFALAAKDNIRMYPNPASTILHLVNEVRSDVVAYTVVDMVGRILMQGAIADNIAIDISMLPQGTYTLTFRSNGTAPRSKRLVVMR
jgi:hypothetical protein